MLYAEAAEQLEQAAAHCRVAVQHIHDREFARMGAHAWAAQGHALEARERLDEAARIHARRSTV